MKPEEAMHYIGALQSHFSAKFAANGLGIIKPELLKQSAEALEQAADNLMRNNNRLPSPQQLLDAVVFAQKRISLANAKKQDDEQAKRAEQGRYDRDDPGYTRTEVDSPLAKFTVKMVTELLSKDPGCADYPKILEGMRQMSLAYPHLTGWAKNYLHFKKRWEGYGWI